MVKRSEMDAERAAEVRRWKQDAFLKGGHKFNMTVFLKWCQFPEFRVLFRAFDTYPWSRYFPTMYSPFFYCGVLFVIYILLSALKG